MTTTITIVCQRCGKEGELEMHGMNRGTSSSRIFRHLGHNPYSGHLHYQCPACEIVLLIEPLTVLEGLTSGYPAAAASEDGREPKAQTSPGGIIVRRSVQNQQTGSC